MSLETMGALTAGALDAMVCAADCMKGPPLVSSFAVPNKQQWMQEATCCSLVIRRKGHQCSLVHMNARAGLRLIMFNSNRNAFP